MNAEINIPTANLLLSRLTDADRVHLSEAVQELLAHGSILGLNPARAELYTWSRLNLDWLREAAALAGLIIHNDHADRIIQAVPQKSALTLRLRQDATVVLLALWYEFDTQVRDQGATQVILTIEQLNQLLTERLLPELKEPPSWTRLREILRQAERFNLVRLDLAESQEASRIEVLSALKRVIQFNGLEDWLKTAALHRNPAAPGVDKAEETEPQS